MRYTTYKHRKPKPVHSASPAPGEYGTLCRPERTAYLNEKSYEPREVTCKSCLRVLRARGWVL